MFMQQDTINICRDIKSKTHREYILTLKYKLDKPNTDFALICKQDIDEVFAYWGFKCDHMDHINNNIYGRVYTLKVNDKILDDVTYEDLCYDILTKLEYNNKRDYKEIFQFLNLTMTDTENVTVYL